MAPLNAFHAKNNADRQKSALSRPLPVAHGPSAEKTCTTRLRLSAAEDFARSISCPRSVKMHKGLGRGVQHRRTLAHESVLAEEEILILFAV